jgi:hypothetical protein
VYHVHRRLASSAPPHCQRVLRPRRVDKNGPQGTGCAGGPWGSELICDIWTGAAWVSQGMAGRPCSGMAQPGGLAPGLRPGLGTFCQLPYGYAGWCRRPGFGPGRERFAIPPPPPLPLPVPESPRRRMCQHGFPFPSRPLSDDSRAVPVPISPNRYSFRTSNVARVGTREYSARACLRVAYHSVHTPLLLSLHHLHPASNGGG